jgi:SAM-dependent methyltransferase
MEVDALPVDPFVQRRVARTNGNLYRPLVDKLRRYPIPAWPAGMPSSRLAPLLDIGCGWGRWLVSAGRAGYLPVGIDVNVDALRAARRVLSQHGLRGYFVAADLRSLPFAGGIFEKVFSYSVLQHAQRERVMWCVREVLRVLKPGGSCSLEFPVRHGLTNWRHRKDRAGENDPESWCVRYYSQRQLRAMFDRVFGNLQIEPNCFFGTGVQKNDFDLLPWKYKPVVAASEVLKAAARVMKPVGWFSDSVFVESVKPGESVWGEARAPVSVPLPEPGNNLAILPWLRCPVTKGVLDYECASHTLISRRAGLRYRIEDDIPVLIS